MSSTLFRSQDARQLVDGLTLAQKVDRSLGPIREAHEEFRDSLVVANSLGKDSVAVWHLARRSAMGSCRPAPALTNPLDRAPRTGRVVRADFGRRKCVPCKMTKPIVTGSCTAGRQGSSLMPRAVGSQSTRSWRSRRFDYRTSWPRDGLGRMWPRNARCSKSPV